MGMRAESMRLHECGFGLLSAMIGVAKAGGIVYPVCGLRVLFPNQQSRKGTS